MKPCSGTVFLPASIYRHQIIMEWITYCANDPIATDQVNMGRAVQKLGYGHWELPAEYCWVYDLSNSDSKHLPNPMTTKPVIEHMQASRWLPDGA